MISNIINKIKLIENIQTLESCKQTIISLINIDKQINVYKDNLKQNSSPTELLLLNIVIKCIKIYNIVCINFLSLFKPKNKSLLSWSWALIKDINLMENCKLLKNLKLKFSKLSLYNKKLVFYISLKIVELLFYGIVVGLVFASRNMYRLLLVLPFLLENNFKVV